MDKIENGVLTLGVDVGSTTVKSVLRDGEKIIFRSYDRHSSRVREKTAQLMRKIEKIADGRQMYIAISGSAGLGLSQVTGLPFIQEVFATEEVVKRTYPDASCAIELGGEDAKIIFFDGGTDERMNGSCAGGTGAFIDQMATLLSVTPEELNELSHGYEKIYPIASRCGVFAKSDIQPLLNQGARKEDLAASIFQAVVNQTIAGLAQGRKIRGQVLYLGGPLYYLDGLRQRFTDTLKLEEKEAICPEYAIYCVAWGAALYAKKLGSLSTAKEIYNKIEAAGITGASNRLEPLFHDEEEYEKFKARHSAAVAPHADLSSYSGPTYLGIDCGSTTTKLVLLSAKKQILYSYYSSNRGNPVEVIKEELSKLYSAMGPGAYIAGSTVTGYGEELIKNAFDVDAGLVETLAHYAAAKYFMPKVDFILDIGGQDIKCFRIKNGAIDSIMLNEACSSGCGSFLETFAKSMGYSIEDFAKKGLFAKAPVNLGSRCTVFMNSSVKQSQKEGATVEDISAGLSVSVVKNALYKVIRAASPTELGENIVVQGGTFYNDAVLRAFEKELNKQVVRPQIAGLMGAFGAALSAMRFKKSNIISIQGLEHFSHTAKSATCHGCTNNCRLTINTFANGAKYISGNQCEKGLGLKKTEELPNLYEFKRRYLTNMPHNEGAKRGKIGLPLALGMYELLPLWNGIFTALGFETVVSDMSTRKTYEKGQFTIPSDTACYPAKLMHGHIEELIKKGVDAIFYPCLTYNVDEKAGDNHYNCPVVAYYSELLKGNIEELNKDNFYCPYLNVNKKSELSRELFHFLLPKYKIPRREINEAVKAGFDAYYEYMRAVRLEGKKAIEFARKNAKRIMILAGRPYHADAEISHGIDKLANTLGFVVVSEDSVCRLVSPVRVRVLNQWTYHARLYRAAQYACRHDDTELVQLVSFGCGVDAITTDEVRSILEDSGKYYTQIKIDEITNLGAVKIRLRSLLGALEERGDEKLDAK